MFSFLRNRCFLKTNSPVISRNICRSISLTNSYVRSDDKPKVFLKNEQKWTNPVLLQLKKYHSSSVQEIDKRKFMAMFPDIIKDLTSNEDVATFPEAVKWVSELLQYNVPHGKMFRSLILLLTYRMMAKPENQTSENVRLAMILGWCLEILHASYIIADDIIDGSETRRGLQCWNRKEEVGLSAVNDCLFLDAYVYSLIRQYFHDKPFYVNLLDTCHQTSLMCSIAESLEFCTTKFNTLKLYRQERYKEIILRKCTFYTFFVPIKLGMYLAECTAEMSQIQPILADLGYLYQANDDIIDCYGDPTITGKVGTDIEEAKCTWLAVVALQKASPEQLKVMEECYGSPDPLKVAAVKDLYIELGLRNDYAVFKHESMNSIEKNIRKVSNEQLCNLLLEILKMFKQKNFLM